MDRYKRDGRPVWGAVEGDKKRHHLERNRMLRWLQSMSNKPPHHDSADDIDELRHHTAKALHCVKQLAIDLQAAGCERGLQTGWTA